MKTSSPKAKDQMSQHRQNIIDCDRCPRLRDYTRTVAIEKRAAFRDQEYWGRPVPPFGHFDAQLILVGLAPAAHGANRTGRMFTGDRSGEWLYRALFRAGFANQAQSLHLHDGLELKNAFVTAAARCAPPDNKPLPIELERCSSFLHTEMKLLTQAKVYVCLGKIAYDALWKTLLVYFGDLPERPRRIAFKHGGEFALPDGRIVLLSYHPSQQNTFTGRLTEPMFDAIFTRAREILSEF